MKQKLIEKGNINELYEMLMDTHSYVISRHTCDCQEDRLEGRGDTGTSSGL